MADGLWLRRGGVAPLMENVALVGVGPDMSAFGSSGLDLACLWLDDEV